jgi:ATP-dependent RNA helicase SUPV3L1/SUV3
MASDLETRIRHVTAVLGPTNTGKTHLAIERMLGHESGMIGLPLRLLAREVYDKIAARVGADKVALITGEEKIKPERARYWVATVEAMPRDVEVDFLAIDEIQLGADPERGHVFTDRLLHARGKSETLLLGAQTMRDAISDLIPGANFISRPRLSKLTYAGQKKITRLPARSAIVAFSASEVYAIAELVRRQRGGAAVVLGALSPRTRNAQVALYQSGDVDFLVATDAIGMGINLDVDHVAFASTRKFDGQNHRSLTPSELAQIAGRAGRHMNDGTFGVTGSAEPFEPDIVDRLESHTFDPVRTLQWRNRKIDLRSLDGLRESLREMPREQRLTRARMADDVLALEMVSADREVVDLACAPAAVAKLWDVCQVPDYRKISGQNHAELVGTLYKYLMSPEERIPEDWFAKQVAFADRTDGDIDTLANRIAHIRTWTFVSNRADWLQDPAHWQGRTRAIEDSLSDALHERLTQRFVDRRTSALVKGMRDKDELNADIAEDGAVQVENHFVGRLKGFRFQPDSAALSDGTVNGKAMRAAATHVLEREFGMRARRVAAAKADAFKLTRRGLVLWRDEEVAKVEAGADPLKPSLTLLADENLSAPDREKVQQRLDTWLTELIGEKLKPLVEISKAEDVQGLARGIGFRLVENLGVLKRDTVAEEIKSLDQNARGQLRKYGVRFGAFNIFFPPLLKPASAELALTLWLLKHAGAHGIAADAPPEPPRPGLTSVVADPAIPEPFYRAYGFHPCGPRAVRLDILERLADQIRPLLAWRPNPEAPDAAPPKGSTGDGGFIATPEMMSILGCSPDELSNVLKALGFRLERRPAKPKPAAAPAAEAGAALAGGEAVEQAGVEPASAETAAPETAAPDTAAPGIAPAEAAPIDDAAPLGTSQSAVAAAAAEAPAPDAPAPDAVAAAEADAATPAEPVMEEIWRPRRHKSERPERHRHQGEHRHQRGRDQGRHRHGRPGEGAQAAGGQAASGEAQPAPAEGAAAAAPVEGGQPEAGRHERREGRGEHRNREERKFRRDDRPQGERNRGPDRGPGGERGKGERRDRDRDRDRRRDDRGGGRRLETHSAAPPRRAGGAADADSPFAKLMALRETLEKQSREPGT